MLNSREKILKKISKALEGNPIPMPFPEIAQHTDSVFYTQEKNDLAEYFAAEFTKLGGKFLYCANEQEMVNRLIELADANNWKHLHCNELMYTHLFMQNDLAFTRTGENIAAMDASVTSCECAIARLGSLYLSSASGSGRVLSVYAPIHICVIYNNQLVWDIADAHNLMKDKYGENLPSQMGIATGPSRTADIEKTLVVGVHGPKEVYVLFVDTNEPIA
jgi:L-lactate dehydrogenase complex protein LldG